MKITSSTEFSKCPDCGAETFKCTRCGADVPLSEFIDVFHMGTCPVCKSLKDEPCPDHLEEVFGPQTRYQFIKAVGREIARRINWKLVLDWVAALSTLAFFGALAWSWASCDGTVVRGLFWLECIK